MSVARGKATDFSCVTTKNMTMKGANFLEKLLDNQPVEWKKLGEVCEIASSGVDKKSVDGEAKVRLLNFKEVFHLQHIDNTTPTMIVTASSRKIEACNIKKGDVFITPTSEIIDEIGYSAVVVEDIENAVYSYHIMRLRIKESNLLPAYLNYLFSASCIRKQIQKKAQGITRFGLTMPRWNSIEIPLPPLSVQSRIVEILDKFTSLEAELEAELDCRKRQYIYYRELLLDFSQHNNIQWKKLGEVAQYSKGRIDASILSAKNYVGVDNLLQDCQGKKLSEHVPTEGRCTAYSPKDILIGNIRPYLKKIWFADNAGGTNGDVLVIQTTDERVLPEYLYQVLSDDAFFTYDMQHAKGAKMPRGNKDKILDYKIPIPPLSEQERIVEILDKFDTLTNSISEGLPLEIQLRRQQYEYYREQLLAFPHP